MSRKFGLPTADKAAYACLATRVPYGQRLTGERLERIERAEEALGRIFGGGLRVRDYVVPGCSGPLALARIELPQDDIERAVSLETSRSITEALHAAGYAYVTIDLEGLRSGSMDM